MDTKHTDKIPRLISDVRLLISSYLQKELDSTDCDGIVPSHGEIVYNLLQNGEMTMTELSNAISKDRSTVTALVSKLIKKGRIEYIKNPEDLRSKKVRLTPGGMELEERFNNISKGLNSKLWKDVDAGDREVFV